MAVADPRPGQGATHAAAGMLTPIAEAAYAEREIFALGQDSLRRYPGFVTELHASDRAADGLPRSPERSRSPTTATTWPCWPRRERCRSPSACTWSS